MARTTRTSRWLLVAVLAVTLTSACTPDEPDPTTTSSPTSTATPPAATPTTPPTTSPEDDAAAKAEEVLRAELRAQTTCLTDPNAVELTCFDDVAIGTELNDMRNTLISARQQGTTVSGELEVVSLDVRSVSLEMDLEVTPPVVPTVVFGGCIDVSNYNILDSNGQSIVPAVRPAHVSVEIAVANYEYPDPTWWRVAYTTNDEETPSCSG